MFINVYGPIILLISILKMPIDILNKCLLDTKQKLLLLATGFIPCLLGKEI